MNRVSLWGNMGRDAELRHTKAGTPVTNFSLATNETWKSGDGEAKQHTEWHQVVVYGALAEIVVKKGGKGCKVHLEGKLRTRDWTDREGSERRTTEVVAMFLDVDGRRERSEDEAAPENGGAPGVISEDDISF